MKRGSFLTPNISVSVYSRFNSRFQKKIQVKKTNNYGMNNTLIKFCVPESPEVYTS